ncbi:DUF58 domain-containing protein [bacterium]|nr:MAG: DUF58 domain-containing protein [bacterium]
MLSAREMRSLNGLRLTPRKSFGGKVRGERMTRKKGVSIEFADYREYTDGDDLRHLDWNVLARLETPVMRTYRDEEDLAVHILLDRSPSMAFGEPSKMDAARRFALAIGMIALAGGDAVYARALGAREPTPPVWRGRASWPRLQRWAERDVMDRPQTLSDGVREFAGSGARPGVVALMTDGLDPDFPSALRLLVGRGHEVWLVQTLSDLDLDPDLEGDLRLIDGEGGSPVELTANGAALAEYRKNLETHQTALQEACRRGGGHSVVVNAKESVDDVVKRAWRREGWVA